ncbi:MAG: hypothetical protein M1467_03905 [Deltaproteobacteria bacterium]|nr:hypothetical protein [Deltaproteobacteria bacterium]
MALSANSHISFINNIIKYLNKENLHFVKASELGLSRKINEKDGINKENSREAANAFKAWLDGKYLQTNDLRYAALKQAVSIQSVNLRLRESLLVKLQSKDLSNNVLKISEKGDGSKNSRAREIKLNPEQKASLLEAGRFLKDNNLKNLNIGTLKQGRDFANNTLKMFRKETNIAFHYHGERHYTAHEGQSETYGSFQTRLFTLIIKIAIIYAVMRRDNIIEKEDIEYAIQLKLILEKHLYSVYDKLIKDKNQETLNKILNIVIDNGGVIERSKLLRYTHMLKKDFNNFIETLIERRSLAFHTEKTKTKSVVYYKITRD